MGQRLALSGLPQDFEHSADTDQPGAFLNAPLASRHERFIQTRTIPECEFSLCRFTWAQGFAVSKLDKRNVHLAIVRRTKIVVRPIAAADRHGTSAFRSRKQTDACSDSGASHRLKLSGFCMSAIGEITSLLRALSHWPRWSE